MKKHFLLLAILLPLLSSSQDFQKEFTILQKRDDTAAQRRLLTQWEAAKPKDAEMFIAWFNFYGNACMKEVIGFEKGPTTDTTAFVLFDSTGNQAGYIKSSVKYDVDLLKKGFVYIDRGIALYPTRLDMRFGKCYMLGLSENYTPFTKCVVETIDYADKVKYVFTWKDGKPLEDGENFFMGSLQDYVATIYNTENDDLLPLIREISSAALKYHPNHVESLANVALTYILTEDYSKALDYLLKAEKVDPKDVVVLNNIAQCYKRKGEKAKAKIYFEKIIKVGNAEEAAKAKEQLRELR